MSTKDYLPSCTSSLVLILELNYISIGLPVKEELRLQDMDRRTDSVIPLLYTQELCLLGGINIRNR